MSIREVPLTVYTHVHTNTHTCFSACKNVLAYTFKHIIIICTRLDYMHTNTETMFISARA